MIFYLKYLSCWLSLHRARFHYFRHFCWTYFCAQTQFSGELEKYFVSYRIDNDVSHGCLHDICSQRTGGINSAAIGPSISVTWKYLIKVWADQIYRGWSHPHSVQLSWAGLELSCWALSWALGSGSTELYAWAAEPDFSLKASTQSSFWAHS